jgi:hypothetical protein
MGFVAGWIGGPVANWSAEGVSYNGETDQIEALLPTIVCLWVVFNPDHVLGLQPMLPTIRRREMLGVIGNRSRDSLALPLR